MRLPLSIRRRLIPIGNRGSGNCEAVLAEEMTSRRCSRDPRWFCCGSSRGHASLDEA